MLPISPTIGAALIALCAALGSQAIFLGFQARRETKAYRRKVKDDRRNRLLVEFASLDAAAMGVFRIARHEYRMLEEQQARVSRRWLIRRFRHAIPVGEARRWKEQAERLALPLQERLWDLNRSVSLVRLDSDASEMETWDNLIDALGDVNATFTQIVAPNRRAPEVVAEMDRKLREIGDLYDTLFASLKRELEMLEKDS